MWTMRNVDVKRIDVDKEQDGKDQMDRNTERMITSSLLKKVEEKMDVITRRQQNWIGHILRGNSLQRKIMEGRKEGKRGRGRHRQMVMHRLDDGGWIRET